MRIIMLGRNSNINPRRGILDFWSGNINENHKNSGAVKAGPMVAAFVQKSATSISLEISAMATVKIQKAIEKEKREKT